MTDRRAWEPPLFEWSQLGPVPIVLAPEVTINDEALLGYSDTLERVIALDSTLEDRHLRVVHFHELLHLWLYDAGIHGLPEDLEEAIVHALATALVAREDFHGSGGVPEG